MTDTIVVSALVGLTLSALTFILGGDALLAAAVLAAGCAASFALVWLIARPQRRGSRRRMVPAARFRPSYARA